MCLVRYEKRYNEDARRRSAEEVKNDMKSSEVGTLSKSETGKTVQKTKSVSSEAAEQDLDVFLLGDLGDSDDAPGILFCMILITKLLCGLLKLINESLNLNICPLNPQYHTSG